MEDIQQSTESIFYTLFYFSRFVIRAFLIAILFIMVAIGLFFIVYFGDMLINTSMGKDKSPLFGAYVIASPSMVPTIDTNDAIVIKRLDHDSYDVGDIITFSTIDNDYSTRMITHRIVEKETIGEENSNYVTKGDNNPIVDSSVVNTSAIYGKVLFRIPKIGYIQEFFLKPSNYFICLLIPAFIFVIYEVVRIFSILRQKKAY